MRPVSLAIPRLNPRLVMPLATSVTDCALVDAAPRPADYALALDCRNPASYARPRGGSRNGSAWDARARGYGASAAARVDGVRHAESDVGRDRGRPPERARLPNRLGPELRGNASDVRLERRRLAGNVHAPGRQLPVQGRAQRLLDRELRAARRTRRPERPAGRARWPSEVLLRPQDPLDHGQREHAGPGRGGQLPVRARLPRRLAARLPALLARGSGRRRDGDVRDDGAPRRLVRGEGW